MTLEATASAARAHFAAFSRRALAVEGRRQAAVAIVVSPWRGAATYLLTRRALTMRRNAGNYALPGGNFEPGEDAIDAAIRETKEELGVVLSRDHAIGLLDDFVTLGGHVVTPVALVTTDALTLRPDPKEVHSVWRLRLAQLDLPDTPRHVPRPDGGPPILQMRARGGWINAPTAAWHGRHTRLDGVGQPDWTAV
ncbi:MAG: MutT/nudix family protein [Alphaproteobacteria bacterium]|nr:MAG: MutT/nudix family protein [Alphaproteobacteria bacterium]